MNEELRKALAEQAKAWAEFKVLNDDRLKALETKGHVPADVTEKLAKVNEALNKFEPISAGLVAAQEELKAAKARADELEAKFNRLGIPGGASAEVAKGLTGKELKFAQLYYAKCSNNSLLKPSPDELKAMSERFWQFARIGIENMGPDERKALVISDDTAGGYLSPPEYVREIIKAIVLISPVRQFIRMRQTVQQGVMVPKRTSTSSATWIAEAATRSESTNPAYGLVKIDTWECTAEHYVSMQELEDAVFDLEVELSQEFAEQFAKAEGAAFISGNGVGKPLGFLDASVISSSNVTASGTAATIADADGQANGIITACYNLKTEYARNAVWFLNRQTLGALRMLKDAYKQYIWQPGIAGNQPNTILGYPYAEMPDMPAIAANAYPLAFGDWRRAYMGVDRVQLSVLRDPYTKASVGQIKFVARRRIGGNVTLAEAIQLVKCST